MSRLEKAKNVFDENQKLCYDNLLYGQRKANLDTLSLREQSQKGDIFDSMFERPKHWRNFYGNIMHQNQLHNISKHENNYLQREMMKDFDLKRRIDQNVVLKDHLAERGEQEKTFNKLAVGYNHLESEIVSK